MAVNEEVNSKSRRTLIGAGLTGIAVAMAGAAASKANAGPVRSAAGDGGGPLSSATISFGSWMLPVDRHPNLSPRPANHHHLCPEEVTIRAGGCVNFIIAGTHQVLIYDNGTQPGDIDTTQLIDATVPIATKLINDPNGRIYRGLDPTVSLPERVEVVHFEQPGTYLVICALLRHFNEGMFGYITVLP